MFRALIYGFSVNLISTFEARLVLDTISKYPVTIISFVPTMLKRILEFESSLEILKSLRWILLGGGPSPEYLLDICIKEKLNIVKVYGMSETCSGTVAFKLLDEPSNKFYAGTIGSRQTLHFYPHGFEIMSHEIPLAGAMAEKMLEGLSFQEYLRTPLSDKLMIDLRNQYFVRI